MTNVSSKFFAFFIALAGLSACAPQSRFEWGDYQTSLYAYYKSSDQRPQYEASLVKTIAQGAKSGRILNNTTSLTAQDYFLSTISAPFAERGYYVFPAHMVKSLLEKEGLSDAGLVHSANSARLGQLFGCDAVLFIDINKWESLYVVFSTSTNVAFHYRLASCKNGATLWENTEQLTYSPQAAY